MPALPSPGAVLRIQLNVGDGASIEAGSRFYVAYTGGPPNTTDLNTLASDVASGWSTNFASLVQNLESLHGVIIEDLSSPTGAVGTWTGTEAGSSTGNQLPASACVLVNHQVNRKYRGGKPRTYMRGGSTNNLLGTNEWQTAFQTSFLAAWRAFVSGILATASLSITLTNVVNVSYYEGFTVYTTPGGRARNVPTLRTKPVVDVITNSSVQAKIGSQRRRLNL